MKYRAISFVLLLIPCLTYANCIDQAKEVTIRLEASVRAHDVTQQALITIRRTAQDWKNLLLRGSVEKDRQILLKRFNEQSVSYDIQLTELDKALSVINFGKDSLQILNIENKKLNSIYQDALSNYGVESLEAAAKADRQAQGADIKTFRTLEKLDADLLGKTRDEFMELKRALNSCSQ